MTIPYELVVNGGFVLRVRNRGESVRLYIVQNVEKHKSDIAKKVAEEFNISRQAANKHLQSLVREDILIKRGNTRNTSYILPTLISVHKVFALTTPLQEDVVWRDEILPLLGEQSTNQQSTNALQIWGHGFTEIFNNAIDHSEGQHIDVEIKKTAATTEIIIHDDGVGIFKKIQESLGLLDTRHAVLELAKGKLTTDPARHTGEGIFFTSRMFDEFDILSGGVFFTHAQQNKEDWILAREKETPGTLVCMKLSNETSRTTQSIFDAFTSGDFGFDKTVVPVKLAQYGEDNLISRSQAKRLLARFDRFKKVLLNFQGVDVIGQAFADEIFRVFVTHHPEIELMELNANSAVERMISRVRIKG